jgi:hypothetical protein
MKFLFDTKECGLKLKPKSNPQADNQWNMVLYLDSDWASDQQNWKSVSGFTIFLQGAPILWRSQTQKKVSLSKSKGEYYAVSEAAKEIKFVIQVMESIGLQIKKPILVHVDDVQAIFMAETPSATKHTRHIDTRYHFIRDYIIDKTIKNIFSTFHENKSDMFTKILRQIFMMIIFKVLFPNIISLKQVQTNCRNMRSLFLGGCQILGSIIL